MKKVIIFIMVMFLVLAVIPSTAYAEDDPVNEVYARFQTNNVYFVPCGEDTFPGGEVTGGKGWFAWLENLPNETGAPVTGIILNLDTILEFDCSMKENMTTPHPPPYEWSFGSLVEGPWLKVSAKTPCPVNFTPGYSASRSVDKTVFSQSDEPQNQIQTLTIEVTPQEDGHDIGICVRAEEDELVNPVITSVIGKGDVTISPGGHELNIHLTEWSVGISQTFTATIQVTPKVPMIEFMPWVLAGEPFDDWPYPFPISGPSIGGSLSHPVDNEVPGLGTWTWSAEGSYSWFWSEDIYYNVIWCSYSIIPIPPTIEASLIYDYINLLEFTPGTDVDIIINGTTMTTVTTDGYGFAWGEELGIDIVPGMTIEATDPGTAITKELVLANLSLDIFDWEANTIEGTGPVGLVDGSVLVTVGNDDIDYDMEVPIDPISGEWQAIFSEDLLDNMEPSAMFFDDDGDATIAELGPQPWIVGQANIDRIVAIYWSEGVEVTITVDDDFDPGNGVLYEETKTSLGWPFPLAFFELGENDFDLKTGQIVTATGDDGRVKVLELTHIEITDVDIEADTVSGIALPDDKVSVWTQTGVALDEETDGDGNWSADFSGVFDIQYGVKLDAGQPDQDGDVSSYVWTVKRQASITYTGNTLVQYPNQVTLSADVVEDPNGETGDITLAGPVTFTVTTEEGFEETYPADVDVEGVASTTVDLPVGLYTIIVSIDSDYYTAAPSEEAKLAVYDPEGSFVTGGGWFKPEDSQDKVNFGFEVKYKNDGTLKGNLEMIDHSTGTSYKSTDFSFLVVVDNKAYFMGHMMIDGEGSYPFMAIMGDNGSLGKNNDEFYIDIQIDGEHTVFDEVVDNGNIVVHK